MLLYALIGLSLVLVGIAGLQFTFLFWTDRLNRERRKHMHDLERRYARIAARLDAAERRIAEQDELLLTLGRDDERAEEAWADVIDER